MVNLSSIFLFTQLCAVCFCASLQTFRSRGYVYNPQINGWLKLHSRPDEWLSARVNCYLEGAVLVMPWTSEFTSVVEELRASAGLDGPLYSGVHITETTYYDGLFGYVGEAPSMLLAPHSARLKLCGVFGVNSLSGVDCKTELPYICYAPEKLPAEPITGPTREVIIPPEPSCGDKNLGYEYRSKTGHCYKFHPRIVTWETANRTCNDEGARLAVPNSADEARIITAFHAQYLDTDLYSDQSNYYPDWVSVGIFYKNGVYTTVDDVLLEESGYEKWIREGPTLYPTTFPYVVMDRGGKFSTTREPGYPFICEKAPAMF